MRRRTAHLLLAAGLLAALTSAGCATTVSEADMKLQLAEAAKPYARTGAQQVILVWAESRMVAIGLLAEARNDPASSLSRRIGSRLERTHRRKAHAVVGGPYADLSDRILTNALNMKSDGQLRGLKVVFVSDEAPTPDLLSAARVSRTQIHHRTPQ